MVFGTHICLDGVVHIIHSVSSELTWTRLPFLVPLSYGLVTME